MAKAPGFSLVTDYFQYKTTLFSGLFYNLAADGVTYILRQGGQLSKSSQTLNTCSNMKSRHFTDFEVCKNRQFSIINFQHPAANKQFQIDVF